jgi:hypothetical protein
MLLGTHESNYMCKSIKFFNFTALNVESAHRSKQEAKINVVFNGMEVEKEFY